MKPKQSLDQTVSLTLLLTALSSGAAPMALAESTVKSAHKELAPTSQLTPDTAATQPAVDALTAAVLAQNPNADALAFDAQSPEVAQTDLSTPSVLTLGSSPQLAASPSLIAADVDTDPMAQVNNVFELRDVSPNDWAYAALRDLVNRYDCIKGYPDSTFRGDRALSRYEFAAALNACMQVIEQTLAEIGDRFATQEDLESLRRLTQEFETELATLSTQVDDLEERVQFLEDSQFSTTTKLFGQTTIGLQGRSRGSFNLGGNTFEDTENNINVIHTTYLSLFTQFNPRSLLLTTLNSGNGRTTDRFTDSLASYVGLAYEGDIDNRVEISDLNYRHLVTNNLAVMVGPKGIGPVNVFRGTNRIENEGSGSLSRFAQRNPIIATGGSGAGAGIDWQINPSVSLQGTYSSNDPLTEGTLFGGDTNITTFGLQVVAAPTRDIDISLQYINSYNPFGRLGAGIGDDLLVIPNFNNQRAPISTDAYGLTLEWRASDRITFGGWTGYTVSDYLPAEGTVETFNWMTFLNFPDLGGDGNLLGLYFGQPPRISYSNLETGRNIPSFINEGNLLGPAGGQQGATYHLEAFYRWRLNNNISITPGVIWLISPFHNGANDDILIGAVRTTFSF
ncbi:iron uptake porin [Spirulina major CS-329]|uniref:iron uptake porin n=1 Tax=Spirulina TaxID=1154 RepID=UPI00232C6753|nr:MULTISPECIES: iron uptake porin [Spirulina]MDB9495311.1 iron uptake porin [Spirulina subsalsa CS-330]MDB9504756.1 iron uptake porin [Spirulina major CS-329]